MATRLHTDTPQVMTCPICRIAYPVAPDGPTTTDGWYGNTEVRWGHVGGVYTTRIVRSRCPICRHEQPWPRPFDD